MSSIYKIDIFQIYFKLSISSHKEKQVEKLNNIQEEWMVMLWKTSLRKKMTEAHTLVLLVGHNALIVPRCFSVTRQKVRNGDSCDFRVKNTLLKHRTIR